jgi:hypothetical protein
MVVARKSRKQTNHRIGDLSGAVEVKPASDGLAAVFIDMRRNAPAAMLVRPLQERGPASAVGVEDKVSSMRIAARR